MPPDNRELVYCHSCENEWYRDEHGLVCSDPDCGSDAVEIIDPSSDPRHQDPEPQLEQHPLHQHNPWNFIAPDGDEAGNHGTATQISAGPPNRNGAMPSPFENLFGSILGVGMQPPGSFPGNQAGGNGQDTVGTRNTSSSWSTSNTYSFSMSSGPNGVRITRTTGFPPGGATGNPNDDLTGILRHMMEFMGPPPGARQGLGNHPGMPPFNPIMNILMGGMGDSHGDVAYTQEGFDRIMTMLRDQHGGAEGPPPATEEAIAALPKIKISKEHLDEQNKAECSICMDPVNIGDEVTMLPCDHWFHGDCIKSWLIEHDTCPQCRRGITPRDGDRNQPRTTGQAPRNWNLNEGDLEDILGRESTQTGDTPGSSNRNPSASLRTASGRPSILATVASNVMRRLAGGGSGNNSNGNSSSSTDGNRRNSNDA